MSNLPNNEFHRLMREASELDVHDATALEAFIQKLARSEFKRDQADAILRQIKLVHGTALSALMAERFDLENIWSMSAAKKRELDVKIRDEKNHSEITLTALRRRMSAARVAVKVAAYEQKQKEEEEKQKPPVYAKDLDLWTPVQLSRDSIQWVVICCPFCGEQHRHGAPERSASVPGDAGRRAVHCRQPRFSGFEYRLLWDGVSVEPERKPKRGKQRAQA